MSNKKHSLTTFLIFSVAAVTIAFGTGYYFGQDSVKVATVVKSIGRGVAPFEAAKNSEPTDVCKFRIYPGNNNEARSLIFDKLKIMDIESYKVVDKKLFYSAGPVYGKPEIGVIDCISAIKEEVVPAENKQGKYPYGSDFFRINKVSKNLGQKYYLIEYYYGADVDQIDFKKFENSENLKTFKYFDLGH